MNYCSIEDAWGSSNNIGKHFTKYMEEKNSCSPQLEPDKQVPAIEHFRDDNIEIDTCDNFILHIKKCKTCYNRIKNQFISNHNKPRILDNINSIVDEHRESIVLVLIGISILLFFNLINNMTKSK
jgi:hypothetical protein